MPLHIPQTCETEVRVFGLVELATDLSRLMGVMFLFLLFVTADSDLLRSLKL